MADYILSTDAGGRPRYRDLDSGRLMPSGFRPPSKKRSSSPTSQIRGQLSGDSSATLASRMSGGWSQIQGRAQSAGSRGAGLRRAADAVGGMVAPVAQQAGAYNRELDAATRMNPYGGETPNRRMAPRGGFGRKTGEGFEGYYDEIEFEDSLGQTQFYPGDAGPILRGMAPERVVDLQRRLHRLGFLSGDYTEGVVRDETRTAFADLLGESNRRGTRWDETLSGLEQMYEELGIEFDDEKSGEEGPAPFVRETYMAPDYATLAQKVREEMGSALGRDPDDSEMAQLTAELQGWDRDAYEADQDAAEQFYDAQVAAGEDGTEGLSGGEGQTVDPVARFKEAFQQKFAGELRGIQRTDEAAETGETVRGATSTLSQMSGGMG